MATPEEEGREIQARVRRGMGPEMTEVLLASSKAAPAELTDWPPERMFQFLRCRLRFTQEELAGKAGLTQSQVSRLESGADSLLSTWLRAYAAIGFKLVLLPASDLSIEELERRSETGRPDRHWMRQRSRPRRHWFQGRMMSRAELNAARDR